MRVRPTPTPVAETVSSRRPTTRRGRAETVAIVAVFALYAAFLLKLLLFSRAPGSERSINLIPFRSITEYASGHSRGTGRIAFANVVGNVLVFIPLGVYASWLRRRAAAWVPLLIIATISVSVEIIQGALGVGATDIDDVILNCVGGAIGTTAFRLLTAILSERSSVRSALTALSLLTMPLWCFFLFVVRLHL